MLTTVSGPPHAALPHVEGTTHRFRCSVRAHASAEALWRAWTDVARWPSWDDPLEWSRLDAPDAGVAPGATGVLKSRGAPPSRFTILARDLGGYAFASPLPWGRLRVDRSFRVDGDALVITHEVSFEGIGGWLLAFLLAPGFRRALPRVMRALANAAERGGG